VNSALLMLFYTGVAGDTAAASGYAHEQLGVTVISESTTEPIEVDEAGGNLRAPDDGDGTYVEASLISLLIKVARQICEESTELSLIEKTLEVSAYSFSQYLELPCGPVKTIVSVTYTDTNGTDVVLAADQYRLSTSSRMAVLRPAYGITWPCARRDLDSVRVRYTAGYSPAEVPAPIRQAMHLCIAHFYANREAVDVDSLMELPLGVRSLLARYRQGLGV
jgi:uncharacterized phiE125 gp8 family phage protein